MTDEHPTQIDRSELDEYYGKVPETIAFDRIYRWEGRTVGEQRLEDGSIVWVDIGNREAHHIPDPSGVDTAEEVLWERSEE